MSGHPNAVPYGMPQQPLPGQMPQYAPGQPYVQPQVTQNRNINQVVTTLRIPARKSSASNYVGNLVVHISQYLKS